MGQRRGHGVGRISRECILEMNYLRGACGVTKWNGVSNENVYERCGMERCGSGVRCGVVE